tara:strand:- start:137 stop:1264 length:1128 start_codon:yes stop_codon:yes gene_type:complete
MESLIKQCPVCSGSEITKIFQSNRVAKYNLNYLETLGEALSSPYVTVNFVECNKCGFLFNSAYEQLDYDISYDANRSYSQVYDSYLNKIVNIILENVEINCLKNVLEIGFGDGKFLEKISLVKSLKQKNFFGFDPSYQENFHIDKCELSKQYYSKDTKIEPNILILRHTLEHISNVQEFMHQMVSENPEYLFIEVPCKRYVYETNSFHYFSNEHCSYFDKYSLMALMENFGYIPKHLSYEFNNENLVALFHRSNLKDFDLKEEIIPSIQDFDSFKLDFFAKFDPAYDFLWGASGKGVCITNILGLTYPDCDVIVDINKDIQGKYLPGSGIKVISPEDLSERVSNHSKVIVLNALYQDEVRKKLESLGFNQKVIPI